jgi:hypothetical protein
VIGTWIAPIARRLLRDETFLAIIPALMVPAAFQLTRLPQSSLRPVVSAAIVIASVTAVTNATVRSVVVVPLFAGVGLSFAQSTGWRGILRLLLVVAAASLCMRRRPAVHGARPA